MTAIFLLAFLLVALMATAVVAAPLRRASPRSWLAVLAAVPLLAIACYQILGTPAALDPARRAPPASAAAPADGPADPAQLAAALAELRAELQRNPNQPEGWALLARSLAVQGDLDSARDAWAMAVDLLPDDANLLTEAAQARAQAHPNKLFDEKSMAMLQHALKQQPQHQRARWFLGIAQRQAGRDADAAATWEPLLVQVDGSTRESLRKEIDAARAAAGMPPLPATLAPEAPAGEPRLAVKVQFAPNVRVDGNAVVFVSARAVDGPPMPVAAQRHRVADLPAILVLDDSDSLMPTARLSQTKEVEVTARLSATGSADRSDADIEAAPVRVRLPHAEAIELVIGAR